MMLADKSFQFAIAFVIFSTGAYLFYRLKFLSKYGSLLTGFLGVYFTIFAGISWIIPVLYFFSTSVFFTKINHRINNKKSSVPRNAWQVLANILPALIASVFFLITRNEIFILIFISLIAAVTADTWASEIGPVFNKTCFSLADFRTAKAGTSGGISLAGTITAFLGSLSVSLLSIFLFLNQWETNTLLVLTISGFLAAFVDSLLGAFWEPVLLRKNFFSMNRYSGEYLSPNDLVNVTASISSPLLFLFLRMLFA